MMEVREIASLRCKEGAMTMTILEIKQAEIAANKNRWLFETFLFPEIRLFSGDKIVRD